MPYEIRLEGRLELTPPIRNGNGCFGCRRIVPGRPLRPAVPQLRLLLSPGAEARAIGAERHAPELAAGPFRPSTFCPVAVSHTRTDASRPPLTRRRPSGDQATPLTARPCPVKVRALPRTTRRRWRHSQPRRASCFGTGSGERGADSGMRILERAWLATW